MPSIRDAFKNWISEKNAIGLTAILTASENPAATLQVYHQSINEKVIEELIFHSYHLAETESVEKGLAWAEIARQASLLGGGAKEYADCLDLRASLLQKLSEKDFGNNIASNNARALLLEALECSIEALQIYQKANVKENLPVAYGRISVLRRAIGNELSALDYRLKSLIGWTEMSDAADAMPTLLDDLDGLYRSLKEEELKQGAEMILHNSLALQEAVRWLDEKRCGNLFAIFGSAHSKLDHEEEALLWWNRAITQYRKINSQAHEFVIWSRLQDYAYDLGKAEKIVEYGKRCIESAPNNIEPSRLAFRYQLLAFGHKVSEQPADAVTAYHRAAELFSQDKEKNSAAGECLLDAGILEEDIGQVVEAENDLEKVLSFSGGARTFWLARISLANLYWKRRGNLGAAIQNADHAVQLSIGMRLNFAERAVSHYLSGSLHLISGNHEKALHRFEALLKILAEDFERNSGVYIGYMSWFPVISPSKSEAALLALIASRRLNRESDTQYYLKLYQSSAAQDFNNNPPENFEELGAEDTDMINLSRGMRLLAQADQLAIFEPKRAIEILENTLPLLENFVQGLIVAHRNLGIAKLLLKEFEQARHYFNHTLQLLTESPDIYEEIICRQNLGVIEMGLGNIQAAHEQFVKVVQLKEAQRVSLTNEEQRFLFLQNEIGAYMMLLATCLELHLFREAFQTIEKIKSRVLQDLLAQADKKPIDYQSLYKIKELKKRREDWDRELLLETHASESSKLEQLMETDKERAEEWLYTPVKIYEEIEAAKQNLQDSNLLFEMESQNTSLSFDDIRAICRAL